MTVYIDPTKAAYFHIPKELYSYLKQNQWNSIAFEYAQIGNDRAPRLVNVTVAGKPLSEQEIRFIARGISIANIDRFSVN